MCRHANMCHDIHCGGQKDIGGVSFLTPTHATGLVASTFTTVLSWGQFLVSLIAPIFQIHPAFDCFPCLS